MYKILFVGVGSIATRHIINLSQVLKEKGIEYRIDVLRSGQGKTLRQDVTEIVYKQFSIGDTIPFDYDIAFITNPTAMHFNSINQYVNNTQHMFIEKPIFDNIDYDIKKLNLKDNSIYYVACPLRYSSVLQYVKKNIDCSQAIAVRSLSSSYLPDWRPETDYRRTYSAHRDLGGGVSIDLIHEWDYLTWLFGMPDKVESVIGKYSSLEIDSDDSALYIGKNENMTFELHLDYYGRKTLRSLQIFLPDETIDIDLINSKICYLKQEKDVDFIGNRDAFQRKELKHFLDIIEGKCKNDNDIYHALDVLKLSRGISG